MLAVLLGVPQEDRRRLLRWSNLIIGINNSDIAPDPEREVAELQEFGAYFLGLLAERSKAKDGPDLISLLAHSEVGKELSPSDYVGTVALLVVGGNDTTRNSISGGLLALVENPIEYRKLRDDRALIPSAVSEMIRWVSPVAHMCRTAVSDYRLRGKKIREGDRVVLWYVSANRDEEVFSEADRFLVERYRPGSREPRHLSFGAGIHFCLGARLAEMQLRCLWEEVLDRYPQIDLAVAPLRVHSSFVNGFKSLPVRIASRP
jgi:cytochrome P450